MTVTEYTNTNDELCVSVEYEDGSTWSGFKTAWDALNADSEGNL